MSQFSSFTYIISSSDRVNSVGTNTNTYDIDFGGFNSNCNDYHIEILNVLFSENTLQANSMLILVANELADIGYFCPASLNSTKNSALVRPTIIGLVPLLANIDMFNSGSGGISFNVKNIRIKRRIRFKILLQDYTDAVSGTDINVAGAETKWYITMRVSPME
jgi:hypothetical protein